MFECVETENKQKQIKNKLRNTIANKKKTKNTQNTQKKKQ